MRRLLSGWVDNADLPFATELLAELLGGFQVVLVTCLDSSRAVWSAGPLHNCIEMLGEPSEMLGDGLMLGMPAFVQLLNQDTTFFGFDEVFFSRKCPTTPKPPTVVLTSEVPINERGVGEIHRWMSQSGCCLGLGDGCGLNFATYDLSIAESLLAVRGA